MINIAIVDDDFNFLKLLEKKLISLDCSLTITCYTNPNDLRSLFDCIANKAAIALIQIASFTGIPI